MWGDDTIARLVASSIQVTQLAQLIHLPPFTTHKSHAMKITGVRTILYEFAMKRSLGDANSPRGRDRASSLAIFIDSDEGVTGISYGSPVARPHIHSLVDQLLVGRDPRGVRGLWQKMDVVVFKG